MAARAYDFIYTHQTATTKQTATSELLFDLTCDMDTPDAEPIICLRDDDDQRIGYSGVRGDWRLTGLLHV